MKSKLELAPKINTKHTLIYTATGIVAVLLIGIGAFFFLNFGSHSEMKAETAAEPRIVRSKGNGGNWNSSASWDIENIPTSGDRVIIESGDKITLTSDKTHNGDIVVNGELSVQNARLSMNEDSRVAVNEGGLITFSSPVRKWYLGWYNSPTGSINIGGTWDPFGFLSPDVWSGGTTMQNETINGPAFFGDDASLLPIELISFDAALSPTGDVSLTWATAAEMNNDFFTIERSVDGKNFFILDTLAGAGNSNIRKDYSYTDTAPVAGYNYYRLKQTDYDGKFEYFDVATVVNDNVKPELSEVSVGPNPFRDEFEVKFYSVDNSSVHLKLMDMQGKAIFTKSLEAEKGPNTFSYYDQENLKPGVYIFTIVQQGTPAETVRLVKN